MIELAYAIAAHYKMNHHCIGIKDGHLVNQKVPRFSRNYDNDKVICSQIFLNYITRVIQLF